MEISPSIESQIKRRFEEVRRNENARYYCAKHYRLVHYLLGIPAAVLSATVSSSLFYFLNNSAASNTQKIALASASALAAALTSVQTFFQPSKIAESNLDCGRKLHTLRLKSENIIAQLDLITREEAEKFLEQSATDMENASAGIPEIPDRIWKKFCEVESIAKDLSEK